MAELLGDIVRWMEQIPPVWAYTAILLIAYGENVIPPIPGDLIVVFGGYLAGIGQLNFVLVVLLSTLGGGLGFMTMYLIGYRIGDAVLDAGRLRWLPKNRIEDARKWFARWGYGVVAANRFLSGARSVIALTVGMAEMDARTTAVWATVSAAVWTSLIAYGGLELGENWPLVADYLRAYYRIVLVALAVVAAVLAVRYYVRRRRSTSDEPKPTGGADDLG